MRQRGKKALKGQKESWYFIAITANSVQKPKLCCGNPEGPYPDIEMARWAFISSDQDCTNHWNDSVMFLKMKGGKPVSAQFFWSTLFWDNVGETEIIAASQEVNKVLKTKPNDLPLLVSSLKTREGIACMGYRLKEGI